MKTISILIFISIITLNLLKSQTIEQYTHLPVSSNMFDIADNFGDDNKALGTFLHYGIDIFVPDGTNIFVTRNGKIEFIERLDGIDDDSLLGEWVIVDVDNSNE